MDTKLTLNINKDVVEKAKHYARSKGNSLSEMVENYLKLLIGQQAGMTIEYSSTVKSLLGSVSLPEDFDYKKEISDYLTKKYTENE